MLLHSGAVHQQSGTLTEIDRNWGFSGPQILKGIAPPKFWTKFIKLHLYLTFSATEVAYQSSKLEFGGKRKNKKIKERNFCCKIEYLHSHYVGRR